MMQEVLVIPNPMIGESALPDFSLSAKERTERMRIAALDELNGVLDCHAVGRSK
jgi:hypothetical protein